MYENIISIADMITLALSLAACVACYYWGVKDGVVSLANILVERGMLKPSDLEEL